MGACAERETAAVRALDCEGVRIVIELRIAIGRRQKHQDHITRIKAHTFDFARRGNKATGVLHRGVEPLNLRDQFTERKRIAP